MKTEDKPLPAASLSEERSEERSIANWARHIMSQLPADEDDARAVLRLVNKMFAVAASWDKPAPRRRD
jgi:hypothetical protein